MQSLASLPPEILDLILGNSGSSFLIIKLWRCGDSNLCSKLSRGITYLDLKLHPQLSSCPAPFLVSNLRNLRHLSLQSDEHLMKNESDWVRWTSILPNSLKTLIIDCLDSCLSIVTPNEDKTPDGLGNQSVNAPYKLLELDRILPKLTTLLIGSKAMNPSQKSISVDFTHLPPSLTHLCYPALLLYTLDTQGRYLRTMAVLPRSLVQLEAFNFSPFAQKLVAAMAEDWLAAPPQLEICSLIHTRGDRALNRLHWLPKTLKECHTTYTKFTPHVAVALPTALESLQFYGVELETFARTKDWTLYLPRGLTTLKISSYDHEFLLGRNISTLPRTLRKLVLQATSDIDWQATIQAVTSVGHTIWPPHLENFQCLVLYLDAAHVSILPQTLTRLALAFRGDLDASKLPPRLVSLRFSLSDSPDICKIVNPLPTGLQELSISGRIDYSAYPGPEIFPESLTSLSAQVRQFKFSDPDESRLHWKVPSNLTKLDILVWRCEWFEFLPRSLTVLMIGSLFSTHGTELSTSGNLFTALPPSLTLFRVTGAKFFVDIPHQRLSHLSRLHSLRMSVGIFPSSMIREMPRSLRTLYIDLREINDEDVPYLPPFLHDIYLGASPSPSAMALWPMPLVPPGHRGEKWEKRLLEFANN